MFASSVGTLRPKWVGKCPACQEWNTFVEEKIAPPRLAPVPVSDSVPIRFDALEGEDVPRMLTGIAEFDRVLGGGVVAGALTLLGGDPGVGKSTLMLAVCGPAGHPASDSVCPQGRSLRARSSFVEIG